jgi:membrane-associated protein
MDNLTSFIIAAGYVGVFVTIFVESGIFVGFFLPGDSLLFTLGILASQGHLNIYILVIISWIAAVLGDNFGYWLGTYFGPKLFNRPDSIIFKQEYVTRTEKYFKKYGKKTIIVARFIPVVRAFAPVLAGIGNMEYRSFLRYNIIGGFFWSCGFLLTSFALGSVIPGIEKFLPIIILVVVVLSFLPLVYESFFKKSGE